MTFGEKIVFLRKSKGMSQDQLAELLGVTRQSVSKWERDEVVADTDRILALSKLFGVSCDYLLNDSITDAANSKAIPPAATPLPTKSAKKTYWHWFGLFLLLWGLGDLLVIRYIFTAFMRLRIRDIPFLVYELFTSYPQGIPVFLFCLLALLFMLAKIGVGLFLIIRGCKRNAKIARESQRETPLK